MVDVLIASMQQEMFKDAFYFFEQAKANDNNNGDPFETWRYLRAAILFSFAAIESCINQFIDEHIERNRHQMLPDDIDYWSEKKRYVSITDKLNRGVKLYGGTSLNLNSGLWSDFSKLKDLRDDLVHYKVANRLYYDTKELFERTEKGIRTTGAVIKAIYTSHPQNVSYPQVFDTIP